MDERVLVEGVSVQILGEAGGEPSAVVLLHGGFDPEQEPATASDALLDERGLIQLHLDLPGGEGEPTTTGDKDHFGPDSAAAVQTALRYAAGEALDGDDCALPDRIPGLSEDLLLAGVSNGGNLSVQVLATPGTPRVRGLVTWETPLGAQAILQELVLPETGACGWGPDFGCQVDLSQLSWRGKPWLDRDEDGEIDEDEPSFEGLVLPEGRLHSPLLHDALGEQELTVSAAFSRAWFAERDAGQAGRIAQAVEAHPELAVIVLGSETDHVQVLPGSPHVLALGQAFLEAGAWVRLNPDARYTQAAENDANSGLDPEEPGALVRDSVPRETLVGGALEELAWRLRWDDWSEDLD